MKCLNLSVDIMVPIMELLFILTIWLHSVQALGLSNLPSRRKRSESQADSSGRTATGQIAFSLTTDTIPDCDTGLNNGGIYALLEFRQIANNQSGGLSGGGVNEERSLWQQLDVISIPATNTTPCEHKFSSNFSYEMPANASVEAGPLVQFKLVQWEHGGGYCNCWGIVPNSLFVEAEGLRISLGLT